jgi:hypothetical protein
VKPSRAASRIARRGDLELDSGDACQDRMAQLEGHMAEDLAYRAAVEGHRLRRTARRLGDIVARLRERLARLREDLRSIEALHSRYQESTDEDNDLLAAWQRLSLHKRIRVTKVGRRAFSFCLLLGLAVLDVVVFTDAASIAFGAARSWTDPSYVAGGAIGLLVFVLGLMSGKRLKEANLEREKRRTVEKLEEFDRQEQWSLLEDPGVHRGAGNQGGHEPVGGAERLLAPKTITKLKLDALQSSFWAAAGVLLVFVGLAVFGFMVRFENVSDEAPAMTVMLGLVPFAVTVIEYLGYDPLAVKRVSRKPAHWWTEKRLDRVNEKCRNVTEAGRRRLIQEHASALDRLSARARSWDTAAAQLRAAVRQVGEEGVDWAPTVRGEDDLVNLVDLLHQLGSCDGKEEAFDRHSARPQGNASEAGDHESQLLSPVGSSQ